MTSIVSPQDKNNSSADFEEFSFGTHIMYDCLTFKKKGEYGLNETFFSVM